MRKRTKVISIIAAILLIVACGGGGWALATVDQWLFDLFDPGTFDPATVPPAPDFHGAAAWAALPTVEDGADVFLAELPAVDQAKAPVDVFYVHPTTWMGRAWNGPTDDPAVIAATTRGGTLIQASVFNGCCAVYAPRYRQANGLALIHPDAEGDQALEIAYADVSAAFDVFLEKTGERGFIIAGHSQGTVLAARLLRSRIAGTALQDRLVAAYLPGAPIRTETVGGLPTCVSARQTGCVVTWNARGPSYRPNGLEYDADHPETLKGRICVNPLSWDDATAHAPASANAGAVFFDTDTPAIQPAFADAQCVDGVLVITTMGDLQRDFMSRTLLWMTGPQNYHPIEYQLFYVNLRQNAAERVAAFLAAPR